MDIEPSTKDLANNANRIAFSVVLMILVIPKKAGTVART